MNRIASTLFLALLTASICCLGEDTPYQRELLAANVPIRWDGLVLDQDGKPMQGIMVTGTADAFARSPADATGIEETERALTGTSDAQGRVTLEGLQGYRLRLAIRKEGYADWDASLIYNAPGRITEADGLYTGTPGNPMVVNLWKRGPAVSLIELKRRKIIPPNVPMSLSLLTGRIAPWREGDGASLVMTAVPAEVTVGRGAFERKETVIEKLLIRSDVGRLRPVSFRMARQVFGLPDRMLVEGTPSLVWERTNAEDIRQHLLFGAIDGKVHAKLEFSTIWSEQSHACSLEVKGIINPDGASFEYDVSKVTPINDITVRESGLEAKP